ncbi:TLC domain-containing protein 5 [Tribolium castaneum]|uniref:Transmembrane protein 136-like Protein n=1 Tax=Tribolium castaneum TaxID=7070 RepID=D2A2Y8_TRICA|nr:PREDICTED: transmembrane protein 136 [Tribolium castaneum]EFA01982.1 Transmembrane protein 136-like Protein [Tribolium castaneum]|eukprot:XP_001813141.1 PREDICTED: transmembrane protein 136 [Tribolium castaneum]
MVNEDVAVPEETEFTLKYNSWYAITISTIIWAASYQLLRATLPSKNREYCCRVLSFLHGIITAFVGINQCFLIDTPFEHPEWRTTNSQRFLMVCSLGYFIHDLVWCFVYQRDSKLMLAHHLYSVCALRRMLYKNNSGAQATCALGSMEISNPMLQIRWFLRSEGYYPSNLYTSVEITFMIIFFLVRIVLGTYFLIVIAFQPKNDWDFRVLAVTIYAMSWMFMINITKYFVTKYGLGYKGNDIQNKGT